MNIHALICNNCGGQVDRDTLTCKSCGTQFEYDNIKRILIEKSRPYINIEGKVVIPSMAVHHMDKSQLIEMSLNELATTLVPKIMPLLEYIEEFDPRSEEFIMRGRLRVMNPTSHLDYIRRDVHD